MQSKIRIHRISSVTHWPESLHHLLKPSTRPLIAGFDSRLSVAPLWYITDKDHLNENGKSQPHLYETGDSGHFDFGRNVMLADARPVTFKVCGGFQASVRPDKFSLHVIHK
jgi:hypothetical protein